jgi:hypothetical protein
VFDGEWVAGNKRSLDKLGMTTALASSGITDPLTEFG